MERFRLGYQIITQEESFKDQDFYHRGYGWDLFTKSRRYSSGSTSFSLCIKIPSIWTNYPRELELTLNLG